MSKLPSITISALLDAGVHFGHKAARWNPKMAPYIYGIRNDIHIIDLQNTAVLMQVAMKQIFETVKNNGRVLFVGTKVQASDLISECAEKCGQYYMNHRWLGGTLTNWGTVSKSIKKLEEYEQNLSDAETLESYTKKEILEITRKKDKLFRAFAGIRNMGGRPDLIVIIDTNKEHLAIEEAQKLHIPIIAITDTNSDPDPITYPIPGNDDAIRSIKLYTDLFASAALAGIAESLTASGVDLGSSVNGVENTSDSQVKKMSATKKVSKAVTTKSDAGTEEFEEALKKEEKAEAKAKKAE
jgi:small subunit ribosomal protein S2